MATKSSKTSKPKSTKRTVRARKSPSAAPPARLFAQASPRSIGGVSLFEAQNQINSNTVATFFSETDVIDRSVSQLQEAGFEILQISPATINIAGPVSLYERAFNTKIVSDERPVLKSFQEKDTATFWDSPSTAISGLISTAGTSFEGVLEGVAIEEPRYFMGPSMFAPLKSYWHLRLPGDLSLALNADRAHRAGITGRGIKVAQVDTGWFKHPYFVGRGYNAAPVVLGPATVNPLDDEVGHGTGESANIFAVAPDIEYHPVKMNFVNSIGAFNAAVGLAPQIITCSWGSSQQFGPLSAADQALAAAIAAAVAGGIIVIFSAGNGHFGFPGQHPDVISAGGTFMNPDESLTASNYASGFASSIFPGRNVPDLCGLVGMLPKAIYIMFPLQPNDQIDVGNAGGTHPNGDETNNNDGWAAFSGTSAAAPQLAGVSALIKQACPALTPAQVKDILIKSARDVTTGTCNPATGGNAATVGPDLATGAGLADAQKAVLMAKVKCLGPIIVGPPITIRPPITVQPPVTVQPPITVRPPITVQPPIVPIRPIAPIVLPPNPASSQEPGPGESQAASRLSERDVEDLHDMIIKSEIDFS
jgi:hypothetical protein